MKPSGKTPYEIRLELLQLAQTILHEQHKAAGVMHSSGSVQTVTAPTTEQIIAEAEKMNSFISKANQSH